MTQTMTETITDPAALAAILGSIVKTVADMPGCPDFCNGACVDWIDEEGCNHHGSGFTLLTIAQGGDKGEPVEWLLSASRTDEDYQAGACDVNLLPAERCGGVTMTPAEARQLAALLLNTADLADPLPLGVLALVAEQIRVGDQLHTVDGWQTVVGQMSFDDQVSVWTDDVDHEPDTNGWGFEPGDAVLVRRRVHGSCAIQFMEPTR